MLDPRRLRLLREFANRGSIAAAADALGYTASAVSQQLVALEKEAGQALLDRTARSATLTDAGRRLVDHADIILTAIEAAESDLAAHSGTPTGKVVVTAYPTAAVALAPPVAHRLRRHSALTLQLRQADQQESLDQVRSAEADIALVDDWTGIERPPTAGVLSWRYLCHDRLVLVVPKEHPLVGTGPIRLSDIEDESWIMGLESEQSRRALDRILTAEGRQPTTRWEFEGLDTMITLVARGLGITIAPRMAVVERHYHVDMCELAVPGGRDVYAVYRTASAERPAVAAVLDLLVAAAKKLP
ncbi:molybdate transport repressor ModE-like protein [Stackebrandtia endophytica]|uniref:Molybdate transport repressor ModE-like protein n=1 Tax=Stackebrandtia endophytica TaxID=1496996 RepID=A0A543ARP1_9ACTN|nr:LysR family transcriptional regulator [Stackebrandtia endophytica]TQL75185.1 molybdate transport repressor ModE-like protein [Stackebrandtia endophytica]